MALRAIVVVACLALALALAHAKLIDLSCEQVRAFVDGHNARRLRAARGQLPPQPAAAAGDMKLMVWDEELASKARAWAKRNKFSHNPDRTVASGRFETGENLYWYATTARDATINPDDAVQAWYDEHKDFTFRALQDSDFGSEPVIGHYTQVVWAKSTRVGCAVSQYRAAAAAAAERMDNFLVVCNYGPPGNYLGQTPYERAAQGAQREGAERLACDAGAACRRPYGKRCRKPKQ